MKRKKTSHISHLTSHNQAIGIVVAKFNTPITQRLLQSCLKTLKKQGISEKTIRTIWVPGSYEIPWAAQELALQGYPVVICLGAIFQGETPQNAHIAAACAQSLQDIAIKTRTPCIFGIITPRTKKQAWARTRGNLDRGKEAAEVALSMLNLKRTL
ncbi:MAG: 6,7-dimethyl-8-ribityllumazine synthase [Elusimicrobia bacterium]|nr:6,7-dimethyl-8-ribityllumazine synthase [Elusimicrobiota bacterium]